MKRFFILIATIVFSHGALCAPNDPPPILQACAACHGDKGVSANPEWPHLAGQNIRYLQKQLMDYHEGKTRQSPMMTGLAATLTPEMMESLAQYYAALPRAHGTTPESYRLRGETLYRTGDSAKGVTACIACHGPDGTGNAEGGFPLIAGQQVLYTIQQLHAFQQKARSNDLNGIMQDLSLIHI